LLHFWLPLAHPVAPTPASAVLSGAMIKAGLLGWLLTLPLSETALPQWGTLMIMVGALASIGAALIGVCQHQAKAVLAYSSISQMGLITIMVGWRSLIRNELRSLFRSLAFMHCITGWRRAASFSLPVSRSLPINRDAG